MNLSTAREKAFQLVDLYSRSGTLLDPNATKQKDYTLKIPGYFDSAQKQIATIKKIVKAKHISHNMPVNKLPSPMYQFDIVASSGADQSYSASGTIGAYYFEVDDVATALVEEETSPGVWATRNTITNPIGNAGVFTAYKGTVTQTVPGSTVRIRFVGGTYYNHRNRALFAESFSSVARIPNYTRYVLYTMPSDFYQFNKLVLRGNVSNSQPYETSCDFYWEQRNMIAINWYNVGEYSVEYFAYPSDITSATPDSYEFEIDTEAQEAIPIYAASMLLISENNIEGDRLRSYYDTMLANLNPKIAVGANSIQNVMFSDTNSRLF